MKFANVDKVIQELERDKEEYIKNIDEKIDMLKKSIEDLKREYREETQPNETGMVDYMLETAKKRLGENFVEASDISADLLEDFYEVLDRKFDIKKIIFAIDVRGSGLWGPKRLFFTETEVYAWDEMDNVESYPYKAFERIENIGGVYDVVYSENITQFLGDKIVNVFQYYKDGKQVARLILDFRDFANEN